MIRKTNRYPRIFKFIILSFYRFNMDCKIIRKNSNEYKYQNESQRFFFLIDWITRSSWHHLLEQKWLERKSKWIWIFIVNLQICCSSFERSIAWIVGLFEHHLTQKWLEKKNSNIQYSWIFWNFIILPSNMIIDPWIIKLLLTEKRLEKVQMYLQICYFSMEIILHRS